MKLLACIIIGFTAGCLISYCALKAHPRPSMRTAVELRDSERLELKTDDL